MILAFYYHICLAKSIEGYKVPGYLGVFIDSLAQNVNELYLVMHEANEIQSKEADYLLKGLNIIWVNLGSKTPAWHRAIFYRRILKNRLSKVEVCDAFIVRSPTPLAPYFHKYICNPVLWFMIVGDYVDGAEHLKSSTFRDRMIYLYLLYNDLLFTKRIKKTDILVNSSGLYTKYKSIAKSIHLIRTTTLLNSDFYIREDTCQKKVINLLFTGRIDPAKGLFELVEAVSILINDGFNIVCHIVGTEDGKGSPVKKALIKRSIDLGISEEIIFHGRKSVGEELNFFYRMADIYIIPSYHEGFPRTIWEAMANSLPVVTTHVGGIPEYLKNKVDALLIKPRNTEDIATAVKSLIENPSLRKTLINGGLKQANSNTLEIQTKNTIEILKLNLKNKSFG